MVLLILPNQLFEAHPGLALKPSQIILLEESLFFSDQRHPARFHKQKLLLHRATMKRYEAFLKGKGYEVHYIDFDANRSSMSDQLRKVIKKFGENTRKLVCTDPTDFVLSKRLHKACNDLEIECELLSNPGFLNSTSENSEYRSGKNRWFMGDFYKWQRKRLGILMDGEQPEGGQWSYDDENRKKVPKKLLANIPDLLTLKQDVIDEQAMHYVNGRFPGHPGKIDRVYYPSDHRTARRWLKHFLTHRFEAFGDYEDAIVEGESWLWHSVLTPMMNVGLLTPGEVVKSAIAHAKKNNVPINSLEGFLRQVIGWREFMRATYEDLGVAMRTTNHWQHHRSMPKSFYDGTTGIPPVDDAIQRVLDTGYCHHIERLMVLGGFLFLCEIDPEEIYRWFMEMFVDSYDWVMVPNVFAMSQNADGGLITTKPYFSGSSYVRKMSHYKKGPWCDVWDGLYWRWIWNHVDELSRNPRWAMMCSMVKKMDTEKRGHHLLNAQEFLKDLR